MAALTDTTDFDPEMMDAIRRSEEEYLQQQREEAAIREAMEISLAEARRRHIPRETSDDARAVQLALQLSAQEEEARRRQLLLESATYGTIECPPSQADFVMANRFHLQRELGVGIRLVPSRSEVALTAKTGAALEIARRELHTLLHRPDTEHHPIVSKIESLKRENVHVFIDNSNIYLGAQMEDSGTRDFNVRLKVSALAGVVVNSRRCRNRVVFGSKPPANNVVWTKWKEAGFQVHAFNRTPGHGEVLIDDGLLSMINETIAQHSGQSHTLVLLTGDGNDNQGRASFPKSVDLALRHGWKVEMWSWRQCTHGRYRKMQQEYAGYGQFSLNYLDEFRDHITFRPTVAPSAAAPSGSSSRFRPSMAVRASPARPRPDTVPSRRHLDGNWRQTVAVAAPDADENTIVEADPSVAAMLADGPTVDNESISDDSVGFDEDYYTCPIALVVFEDPVRSPHGHYFERSAIVEWISAHNNCPLTRLPLTLGDLVAPEPEFLQALAAFRASL